MSVYLNEYRTEALSKAYEEYDLKGGVLSFIFWQLNRAQSNADELTSVNIHKVVARQTIDKIIYETSKRWYSVVSEYNRSQYPKLQVDYDKLDESGIELTIDEFLGFDYDWLNKKPKFKGKKGATRWYFDHDNYEYDETKKKLGDIGINHNRGFVHAFLYPPYGMNLGDHISDVENYFNIFANINFDDLRNLSIYTWSIDCALFFEFGKEWWGSCFWTVYNPAKDIYIGIVGSETD